MKGWVRPGGVCRPMSVQQHDPVVGEKARTGVEELLEARLAHMLEHAHRHDPVEGPAHVAVVAQLEVHAPRQALGLRPALSHRKLLAARG